jgi:hypothetical protein
MKRSKFLIAACICSTLCLLIWFLPGSYTYLTRGDGCFVTSHTTLYAFFSAFSPLPLICAGISLWAVCIRRTNWPMVCVSLIAAILHAIFLSFIGMVFSLPFLLNLLGAGCLLIHRLNPLKK